VLNEGTESASGAKQPRSPTFSAHRKASSFRDSTADKAASDSSFRQTPAYSPAPSFEALLAVSAYNERRATLGLRRCPEGPAASQHNARSTWAGESLAQDLEAYRSNAACQPLTPEDTTVEHKDPKMSMSTAVMALKAARKFKSKLKPQACVPSEPEQSPEYPKVSIATAAFALRAAAKFKSKLRRTSLGDASNEDSNNEHCADTNDELSCSTVDDWELYSARYKELLARTQELEEANAALIEVNEEQQLNLIEAAKIGQYLLDENSELKEQLAYLQDDQEECSQKLQNERIENEENWKKIRDLSEQVSALTKQNLRLETKMREAEEEQMCFSPTIVPEKRASLDKGFIVDENAEKLKRVQSELRSAQLQIQELSDEISNLEEHIYESRLEKDSLVRKLVELESAQPTLSPQASFIAANASDAVTQETQLAINDPDPTRSTDNLCFYPEIRTPSFRVTARSTARAMDNFELGSLASSVASRSPSLASSRSGAYPTHRRGGNYKQRPKAAPHPASMDPETFNLIWEQAVQLEAGVTEESNDEPDDLPIITNSDENLHANDDHQELFTSTVQTLNSRIASLEDENQSMQTILNAQRALIRQLRDTEKSQRIFCSMESGDYSNLAQELAAQPWEYWKTPIKLNQKEGFKTLADVVGTQRRASSEYFRNTGTMVGLKVEKGLKSWLSNARRRVTLPEDGTSRMCTPESHSSEGNLGDTKHASEPSLSVDPDCTDDETEADGALSHISEEDTEQLSTRSESRSSSRGGTSLRGHRRGTPARTSNTSRDVSRSSANSGEPAEEEVETSNCPQQRMHSHGKLKSRPGQDSNAAAHNRLGAVPEIVSPPRFARSLAKNEMKACDEPSVQIVERTLFQHKEAHSLLHDAWEPQSVTKVVAATHFGPWESRDNVERNVDFLMIKVETSSEKKVFAAMKRAAYEIKGLACTPTPTLLKEMKGCEEPSTQIVERTLFQRKEAQSLLLDALEPQSVTKVVAATHFGPWESMHSVEKNAEFLMVRVTSTSEKKVFGGMKRASYEMKGLAYTPEPTLLKEPQKAAINGTNCDKQTQTAVISEYECLKLLEDSEKKSLMTKKEDKNLSKWKLPTVGKTVAGLVLVAGVLVYPILRHQNIHPNPLTISACAEHTKHCCCQKPMSPVVTEVLKCPSAPILCQAMSVSTKFPFCLCKVVKHVFSVFQK